ncbi:hypothetical protein [Novosphingopyxis sp.]|uniref:hypothetical protein n=1 Tax=Novosphingopyxis sp. TaxID=2709690 RepID=UPI003B5C681D
MLSGLKQRVTSLDENAEVSTSSDRAMMFNETGFFGRPVKREAPAIDAVGESAPPEFDACGTLPKYGDRAGAVPVPITADTDFSAGPNRRDTPVRAWMAGMTESMGTTPPHPMSQADTSARPMPGGPPPVSAFASRQPVTAEFAENRPGPTELASRTTTLHRANQNSVRISLQKGPEGMIVAVRADGLSEEQRESLIEEARSLLEELGLSEAALVVNGRRAASDGQSQERN